MKKIKNKCYYCGKEANYQFKNGKWCCSKSMNSCPKIREQRRKKTKEQWDSAKKVGGSLKSIKKEKEEYDNNKCYYCGKEAKFTLKNGKGCCQESINKCPSLIAKNIAGLKKAYKEGRKDCHHFDGKRGESKGKMQKTKDEVFCINNLSNAYIKKFIITLDIFPYKCDICGIKEWHGKKIILELDHINGRRNDNRKENLRFLCPNCHSQTKTFRGRNINSGCVKVKDKELILALNETPNIRQALLKVGLTPKGKNYARAKKLRGILNCCIDCGKEISQKAKRCKKCSGIQNNLKNRKTERPPKEQLLKEIEELGYCGTGRKYGVSDNAIRKWLKS